MKLSEVQKVLGQIAEATGSASLALKELKASVDMAMDYFKDGNIVQTQLFLEHAFTSLMGCFHYMNLSLENVVNRERQRNNGIKSIFQERVILVFSDHAELRVEGELRGTIPLYNEEDYNELRQIAHLFECRLEHADHVQLNLLSFINDNKD